MTDKLEIPPTCVPEARPMALWLGLAVAVLVIAGLFAVGLVIGRMPPFDRLFVDPLMFRRCLVVHVNLALVFWFYSFVAALMYLLPRRTPLGPVARHSFWFGVAGVGLMALSAGVPGAEPILSNYIPAIDHPLFGFGQLLFGIGVLASFLDHRLVPTGQDRPGFIQVPSSAIPGLRTSAIALVLAAVTFMAAWLGTPRHLPVASYYELLFWGGGHVLQLASVAAMVSVWLILLGSLTGRQPMTRRTSFILFAILLLPWLLAPRLAAMGPQTWHYRTGFTDLMRWGIFPVVTVVLGLCTRFLWQEWKRGDLGWRSIADYRFSGFLVSASLTVLGFVLGAMIRGSNTMVPAHYHASIGAVTVGFMAVTYLLLDPLGASIPTRRLRVLASAQPLVFGGGQMVFAIGFALAGANGAPRKAYGAEQVGRSLAQSLGLGIMGVGGLVAVLGGILFLWIVIRSWRARVALSRNAGDLQWKKPQPLPLQVEQAPAGSMSTQSRS